MKNIPSPTLLVGLSLAAGLNLLRAQNYSIDRFTIDGGGGTITGGAYTVSGTIGQPDAGQLTGGNYRSAGGFWSIIQGDGPPWLNIRLSGTSVVLSWPDPSTGFQLQQTSVLNGLATIWADVNQTPTVANGNKEVTLVIALGNRCFRLRKP